MTSAPNINRRTALTAGTAAAFLTGMPALAKAPLSGPIRPTVRRFSLGAFEVTTILDGVRNADFVHPIFGENVEASEVESLATDNNLPGLASQFTFIPTVVNTGEEVILFDTGNGAGGRPDVGNLRGALAESGIAPEAVDVVVITHMHPDHIGGMLEDGAPAFPNARYVTGDVEYNFWSAEERLSGPTERVGQMVQEGVVPFAENMTFIAPGDAVVSGIEAVDAMGHTPGHLAYHIESEGKRLMITADTANHFVFSLQRPDWHVRFDADKEKAAAARRAVFGMVAADKIPFIGYHMPAPGIGYVEVKGDGFEFTPAAYQLEF